MTHNILKTFIDKYLVTHTDYDYFGVLLEEMNKQHWTNTDKDTFLKAVISGKFTLPLPSSITHSEGEQ